MAFDQSTRNRLQRFVTDARRTLEEEFTRQLQNDYGLDPVSGTASPLESLRHINDQQRETARILRDTLAHYCASADTDTMAGLDRIVREQAFTVLNRLAALRMAEARGLLMESVGNGYQAKGFQLYARLASTGLGETGDAYRVYLQSVFDELSEDLPGLFDRFSPQGRLFPREATLIQILNLINHGEIEPLWAEDETIGWIYQYFNSKEERKAMRDASQGPRNSRELAVRNQFFTPRYVVEFLVDNTLGRLWFNWTGGQTGLRDRCQYLLVKPNEQPEPAKRLRDPRTIKLLDPACGSMHFGLYAFDLFLEIYREAWAWEQTHGPGSLDTETGGSADLKPLSQTYADQDAFLHDVPRLIIEHNIYGVDIDARAAQIASLALWQRAQRAWHEAGVKANDRPQVGRGHVVAAVAPPAEVDLRKRFMEELDPLDAELFEKTLFLLKGLPELGVLLQVEKELPALVRAVFGEHGGLFRKEDMAQWQKAEGRLQEALTEFARAARSTYQGRLFADDALQGLRMIDHCRELYDVIVMNPPFGEWTNSQKDYAKNLYTSGSHDIITAFLERNLSLLRIGGFCAEITSRTCFFAPTTKKWRENIVLKNQLVAWIDLGAGVLDGAMVETCLSVLEKEEPTYNSIFFSAEDGSIDTRCQSFRSSLRDPEIYEFHQGSLSRSAGAPFSYWTARDSTENEARLTPLSEHGVDVKVGIQTGDDFRFIRCWWEISKTTDGWLFHAKGGENEPFFTDIHLVLNWKKNGSEMKAQNSVRLNMFSKHDPSRELSCGLTFAYRTNRFSPGLMPEGVVPGVAGMGVYSAQMEVETLCSILNSSRANDLIDSRLANKDTQALYQAGVIKPTQLPDFSQDEAILLSNHAKEIWGRLSLKVRGDTASPLFSAPFFDRRGLERTVEVLNGAWSENISDVISSFAEIDDLVNNKYGKLSSEQAARVSQQSKIFASVLRNQICKIEELINVLLEHSLHSAVGEQTALYRDLGAISELNYEEYMSGELLYNRLALKKRFEPGIFSPQDIEDWVNATIEEIFDSPDSVSREIEKAFRGGIKSYIYSESGFFKDHLARFSRSRRKAPIYWPISTTSGSYTLWLYYPSLTDQTLFTAVNDFIEPKLKQVGQDVAALRTKGSARSRDDEKSFEALQALELELIELRDTLLAIAQTYRPNHDDGVQITAAPLWQLFRHKPWQKVLKDTWAKLEKGDYDWAHLAMAYWPDRVREKCMTDKSLAIAHDLEHLYVEPEPKPTKASGRKKNG